MSRGLSIAALPAEVMRGLRFVEDFYDKASMLRNEWTLANNPIVDDGITVDGVNQKAEHVGPVLGVQSVSFWITLGSTTEDILQLSAAHSIEVGAGMLTATGWAAPTIMVNGVVTATITTARSFVTVTTATPFDADDIAVGEVATFGDFKMEALKIWANGAVLTLQEALDTTNNATWDWENLLKCNLQFRTQDLDMPNVQTLDSSKWGNHAQLGDGAAAGTFPIQQAGRMYFDGGDYLIVPADASLPSGTYTVLATCQVGVSGVLKMFLDARSGAGAGWVALRATNKWSFTSGSLFVDGDGPYADNTQTADEGLHTIVIQGITLDMASALHIWTHNLITSRIDGTLFDFKIAPGTLTPTQILDYDNKIRATLGSQL
jgi:hypothetical protein